MKDLGHLELYDYLTIPWRRRWYFLAALILVLAGAFAVRIHHTRASTTSLSGASGVKVVCDRWPDASSMSQFASDAIRLMDAKTNEEKALAVWRFVRMMSSRTDGNSPREPALNVLIRRKQPDTIDASEP